jgi:hypothetical protein
MAEIPADVYRDAARAYVGADEACDAATSLTRHALAVLWTRDRRFRAAVEWAFGAGRDYEAKGGWP